MANTSILGWTSLPDCCCRRVETWGIGAWEVRALGIDWFVTPVERRGVPGQLRIGIRSLQVLPIT